VRQLGGVFGTAIAVAVFAHAGGYGSAQAFSDGFVPALTVSAALSLAGALAGVLLPATVRLGRAEVPVQSPEAAGSAST
jgi:hypothetical protein